MPKVIIIGGGIIGLASSYYLRKKGFEVVIIDKEEPGMGCSSGNMGWIVPSLSDPVPAPGLFKTTFQWMMKSDSPLYIKPSALPSLTRWIYHFRKYCNEADFKKGYEAGLEISRDTLSLFDELEKDENIKFEVYKKGLLFVFLNEKYIEEKYNIYCHAEKIGLSAPVPMSKKELLKMEPALSDNVAGGLYLPDERHTRPESLTKAIKDWLVKNGVEVKSHSEVKDFVIKEDEIVGVKTLDETIEGDYFLITTGVLAADMLNKIGVSFPMTAGKGYSITITSPSLQLQQPLYLGDSRVTLSPFSDSLRVGGTMELSGINTNLDQRRIKSLLVTLQDYLKTPLSGENQKNWVGMRPMTPDGLPVLGEVPELKNTYVATGHAMSGISMSLSTGKIMSDLIVNGNTDVNISPFAPDRFNRRFSQIDKDNKEPMNI